MRNLTCFEIKNVHGGERGELVMYRNFNGTGYSVFTAIGVFAVKLCLGSSIGASGITALAAAYVPSAANALLGEYQAYMYGENGFGRIWI